MIDMSRGMPKKFRRPDADRLSRPFGATSTVLFGRYEGRTLLWVAAHQPDYLRYVARLPRMPDHFRSAAAAALAEIDRRRAVRR